MKGTVKTAFNINQLNVINDLIQIASRNDIYLYKQVIFVTPGRPQQRNERPNNA